MSEPDDRDGVSEGILRIYEKYDDASVRNGFRTILLGWLSGVADRKGAVSREDFIAGIAWAEIAALTRATGRPS